MEYLAVTASRSGRKPAVTTTTKIYADEPFFLLQDLPPQPPEQLEFLRIGRSVEGGKLTGIGFDDVRRLRSLYDPVLVEADGAKGRPLKYPSPHEPLIPPSVDLIFVIAGLDGLYGRVGEEVFRWELFCEATGIGGDARVTPSLFANLFHDHILLKGVDRQKTVIVLNKYDLLDDKADAMVLARRIIISTGIPVVVSSVAKGIFYGVERWP